MKRNHVAKTPTTDLISGQIELLKKERELAELQEARPWSRYNLPSSFESVYKYGEPIEVKEEDRGELEGILGVVDRSELLLCEMPALQEKDAKLALGQWADNRVEEARQFASLVHAGTLPSSLRQRFPALFNDVIDALTEKGREKFFQEARRRMMTVDDLMEFIAEVKERKGPTMMDYRKRYRRLSKVGRKR